MNMNFWIVVIWLVASFVMGLLGTKRNNANSKEFCQESEQQVIDAVYNSVPSNYCHGCGPKLSWKD